MYSILKEGDVLEICIGIQVFRHPFSTGGSRWKQKIWKTEKETIIRCVLLNLAGVFIYAVGINSFAAPHKIAPGGASGIAILIQVLGIGKLAGSRYPIVLGSSFAPLSPMILIGKEYGMAALFGSVIASGAVIFLLSFFMDKILKLFPQVVVGTFVTLIGITLAPTALRDLAGGRGKRRLWLRRKSHPGSGSAYIYTAGGKSMEKASGKVCHCFLVLPQERLQDVFYIWWILLPLRRQRYSSRFSLLLTECRNLSCGLFSL
mgnify:CR=1 FL=1